MGKIAVETTIKVWANRKGCEHIEFTKLKCTSNQVADIDSIISNSQKGDSVTLSIAPVQKKLQIKAITSPIKLTGIDCRKSGKKLIVTGFKSPDDRAEIMKRLTDVGTPVIVTIEDKQGKIQIDEQKTFDEQKQSDKELPKVVPSKVIDIAFTKTWRTKVQIILAGSGNEWFFGYSIEIPNEGVSKLANKDYTYLTPAAALEGARSVITTWIRQQEQYKHTKPAIKKIEKAIDDWLYENE